MAETAVPVEVSPFDYEICRTIDELGTVLTRLWFRSFDMLLSCFMPTTQDKKTPYYHLLYCFITVPITLLLSILTLPFALIGTCMWLSMVPFRETYRYSHVPSAPRAPLQYNYTFATINICLLPETVSRFNNLSHTAWRAIEIGKNLAAQQSEFFTSYQRATKESTPSKMATNGIANGCIPDVKHTQSNGDATTRWRGGPGLSDDSGLSSTHEFTVLDESFDESQEDSLNTTTDTGGSGSAADVSSSVHTQDDTVLDSSQEAIEDGGSSYYRHRTTTTEWTEPGGGDGVMGSELKHDVLTRFPPADFLLFQEAWDLQHTRNLATQLHKVYPHIVYDAAEYSLRRMFGSGLMIASRHPFENVQFDRFHHGARQCTLASKGCLHVKVFLGNMSDGRRVVGYIHATHLQAYAGKLLIVPKQMDDLLEFSERFRRRTQFIDDVVAFDVLGGDFNSDNMSPIHSEDFHHRLFGTYIDVARLRPGLDHDWAVGTDMRHLTMNDDLIKTPEGLKRALEDPILRQYYILDGDVECLLPDIAWRLPAKDEHGEWIVSPVGGKRRIDYILCRVDSHVGVRACQPVTQLAGLIDHIAYVISIDTHLTRVRNQ